MVSPVILALEGVETGGNPRQGGPVQLEGQVALVECR